MKAFDHFREALRINPDLDSAQKGLLEALKCRFIFNRVVRWLGFGRKLSFPVLFMWVSFFPFMAVVLSIALLFRPLTGVFLRFDPLGRTLLSKDQIVESNVCCVTTLLAVICVGMALFASEIEFLIMAIPLLGLPVLISIAFRTQRGWPRLLSLSLVGAFVAYIALFQAWLLHSRNGSQSFSPQTENLLENTFTNICLAFMVLIFVLSALTKIPARSKQ